MANTWPGNPLAIQPIDNNVTLAFIASTALTASTHKHAVAGVVPKSGIITGIGFRFGAISVGATTTLTLSLQDTSLSAGPPAQPDGTQDQSATIANADITANTWRTITLGSNRTVTQDDQICVVWEYLNFNASDSVVLSHWQLATGSNATPQETGASHYNGSTWAVLQANPNIVLVYSDGTFATFMGCSPAESLTSNTYNSGSTPDERGNLWIAPCDMTIRGLCPYYQPSGNADLVIYDSAGTELRSTTVDANAVRSNGLRVYQGLFSSDLDITGGSTYYITVRPAATNVIMYSIGVNAAGHLQSNVFGGDMYSATRTNAGAWTTDTKSYHPIGVIVSKIGSTGSGGGLVIHPGMSGGMRG